MINTKMSKLALAIGALVMAGGAWAVPPTPAGDTSTIGVTATIAAACSVGDSTLAFGNLKMISDFGTQPVEWDTAVNSFLAICTKGTTLPKFSYVSANDAAGVFQLKGVTTATELIAYTLHQDASATLPPVSASTPIAHPAFIADGQSRGLVLTAKILSSAKAGKSVQSYSDTITVTSSFGS